MPNPSVVATGVVPDGGSVVSLSDRHPNITLPSGLNSVVLVTSHKEEYRYPLGGENYSYPEHPISDQVHGLPFKTRGE